MKKMTLILTFAALTGMSNSLVSADNSFYNVGKAMVAGGAGYYLNPLLDKASHAMVSTIGKVVGLNDETANELAGTVSALSQQGSQYVVGKGIDYASQKASQGAGYASQKLSDRVGGWLSGRKLVP